MFIGEAAIGLKPKLYNLVAVKAFALSLPCLLRKVF